VSVLVESALKVALIASTGLLVAAALRRQSAALRHWVLALTLVAALAAPLLRLVAPSWSLPVRVSGKVGRTSEAAVVSITPVGEAGRRVEPFGSTARADDTAPVVEATTIMLMLWLAGLVLNLAALAVGLWRLGRSSQRATLVEDGPWCAAMRALAGHYRLTRPVHLLRSDVALPVTSGFLAPRVLLPADADGYAPERIRVVLAHELAHIQRADWLVQLGGELLRAIHWFNPLVWAVCARLRLESEHACDDAVVTLGVPGADYAVHLLELARQFGGSRQRGVPAVAMVSRPSSLERRISAMLNPNLNRRPLSALARLGTVGALLAVVLPIALFAQNTFATLSGSITDESGALLPGVAVVAADIDRGVRHEVHTDRTGRFELLGLPQGAYQLEAGLPGFETFRAALTLGGEDIARNIMMKLGSLQETVVVTNEPSQPKTLAVPVRPSTNQRCGATSVRSPSVRSDGPPLRIGGQIKVPVKIRHVPPIYPVGSAPGVVRMDTLIGTDGFVQQVKVTSTTSPELALAAEAAVRQWQFTQTLLNCEPVDVRMSVLVEFR